MMMMPCCLMLCQRRRRVSNINATLSHFLVFPERLAKAPERRGNRNISGVFLKHEASVALFITGKSECRIRHSSGWRIRLYDCDRSICPLFTAL